MKATEDYVSFETAKALRAIGFNCPCCHYYKRSKWVRRGRFPSKKISPQMYKGYADLIKEAPKIEFINDEGITNQRLTGNESPRMDWADEFVMPHYEYATATTNSWAVAGYMSMMTFQSIGVRQTPPTMTLTETTMYATTQISASLTGDPISTTNL